MAARKVILTHNNADLDALASLYAMHKLTPDADPILPKKLHRNVKQFLLLYGRALSGFNQEVLQREDVELAYVVDSQTYDMVKGMKHDTPVYFIDHHAPEKDPFPPHQHYIGKQTGANTTLLVEMMMERGLKLDTLEATLLMLGIYEDTGNLTYSATTVADIQAAAWLLGQGADLDIVRDFLRHRMDDDQKELLTHLQENVETQIYHGHSIVIASAVLDEPMEDLSTVASELRDLFDTSAMFMVLQVRKNVQMIARSVIDDVDVGKVAQQFEGGGHSRAAAALVRDANLEDVLKKLKKVLQVTIQPAVRVADMMSMGVQTILSTKPIGEAETLMFQSGHEGYPVLNEDGKLVGLLTRRAVERAMHHTMQNRLVSEIMDTGDWTLSPEDSIEMLKDKILDSGWGQIPVVDNQGQVIGIITRTDLITHWGQKFPVPDHSTEIAQLLETALPEAVWKLLQCVSQKANELHYRIFLVGGIVRDLLLNVPNLDIDLVVEGEAIQLARALRKQYGGSIQQHDQFGTAKWKLNGGVAAALGCQWNEENWPDYVDFATSRAEFYTAPTVLPTVRPSSIKMDLHRRDFTINTLAIRIAPAPMGELLDFYKGREDLENGIIRVLHSLSFIDDPTRMMRAVRFEQRFGFTIEERTEQLIENALNLIERVSGDRIRHEINMILAEKTALQSLERLQALGILKAIHPDLVIDDQFRQHYAIIQQVRQNPPWPLDDFDSWHTLTFAILTRRMDRDTLENIGQRLMVSRANRDKLEVIRQGYEFLSHLKNMPPSEITFKLEALNQVGWLACWILAPDEATRRVIEQFVNQWQYIKPTVDGNTLLKLGMKPSPLMGKLLHNLRAAWLDGEIQNGDDEQRYIRQHLQENQLHD